MEEKLAGVNNVKTIGRGNTTGSISCTTISDTTNFNKSTTTINFEDCSNCNGNHYVAKVKPVGEPTLYLYSDENNYINCPICIKPDATNTDNGPGTNSQ